MSLIVKICGLSTPETLDVALDAGADMVGFVFFPPSPRHLDFDTARDLGKHVRHRAVKVALTVNADDATLASVVEVLQPDILQLHGREAVARLRDIKQKFGLQVMKVLAVETAADLASRPSMPPSPIVFYSMRLPRKKPRDPAVSARYRRHVGESRSQTAVLGLRPQCRQCRSRS
jgi:phosphoribosylanthranilate isomerase